MILNPLIRALQIILKKLTRMQNISNIYIDALSLGSKNMSNGISFNDLKDRLCSKGYTIEGEFEKYFEHWFFSNFFHKSATWEVKKFETGSTRILSHNLSQYHKDKCMLTGEAFMNYIEYIELIEARLSSRRAHFAAIAAIIISIILGILNLL